MTHALIIATRAGCGHGAPAARGRIRTAGGHRADILGRLLSAFGLVAALSDAMYRAVRVWRARRNDVLHLSCMDDRLLKDIGLTRSEIGWAVRFGRCGEDKGDPAPTKAVRPVVAA